MSHAKKITTIEQQDFSINDLLLALGIQLAGASLVELQLYDRYGRLASDGGSDYLGRLCIKRTTVSHEAASEVLPDQP